MSPFGAPFVSLLSPTRLPVEMPGISSALYQVLFFFFLRRLAIEYMGKLLIKPLAGLLFECVCARGFTLRTDSSTTGNLFSCFLYSPLVAYCAMLGRAEITQETFDVLSRNINVAFDEMHRVLLTAQGLRTPLLICILRSAQKCTALSHYIRSCTSE
jgi:hypothetical protein